MPKLTAWQKKKKQFKFALMIAYTLYAIIISAVAWANWIGAGADFSEMVENWRQVPIDRVTVTTTGVACPDGYVKVEVPKFPGAKAFCWCDQSSGNFQGAYPDRSSDLTNRDPSIPQCWQNQTGSPSYCVGVTALASKELLWHDRNVCVRRIGSFTGTAQTTTPENAYNRPVAVGASATCPTGYFTCDSARTTKTSDIHTCVKGGTAQTDCPITKMTLKASGYVAQVSLDETCTTFNANFELCVERDGLAQPGVYIEAKLPTACKPAKSSTTERTDKDPRLGEIASCSSEDPRWHVAEATTEKLLYSQNSVAAPFGTSWPTPTDPTPANRVWFDVPTTDKYGQSVKLQQRDETPWKVTCPYTRLQTEQEEGNVKRLLAAQAALFFLNLFLGLADMAYGYWECKQDDEAGWEDDTPRQVFLRRTKICCSVSGGIGKIIPLAIALSLSIRLKGFFADIKTAVCADGDSISQANIDFFAEETKKQASFNIALLVGVILVILMELYNFYQSVKVGRHDFGSERGVLEITVHRASGLRKEQKVGTQDPYCRVFLDTTEQRTRVHNNGGQEPVWEDKFTFNMNGNERILYFYIYNKNVAADDSIGGVNFEVKDLRYALGTQWHNVYKDPKKPKKTCGRIQITMVLNGNSTAEYNPNAAPPSGGGGDDDMAMGEMVGGVPPSYEGGGTSDAPSAPYYPPQPQQPYYQQQPQQQQQQPYYQPQQPEPAPAYYQQPPPQQQQGFVPQQHYQRPPQ